MATSVKEMGHLGLSRQFQSDPVSWAEWCFSTVHLRSHPEPKRQETELRICGFFEDAWSPDTEQRQAKALASVHLFSQQSVPGTYCVAGWEVGTDDRQENKR